MILVRSKAIRTVLWWQLAATGLLMLLVGWLAGIHGAISAMLGGLVSIVASLAFAIVVSLSRSDSLAGTLVAAFRGEAVKFTLAIILLWAVFATYKDVVAIGFIGSFAISILIFGMAFFVREA